ncbi:MAG TPA: carboxypeptidase-like regulatory domain-containing protein [Polyangiaceae bacterium]|nr:carboxypeptidase-like regulatory domain-containing protein [Polyangiaceae bacterium]
MRSSLFLGLSGLSALLAGCIVVEDVRRIEGPSCQDYAVESLNLSVRDEQGAELCDAKVVARDGAFERELLSELGPGLCGWGGLLERPGTYELTVSKPGFETAVRRNVVVGMTADRCHVEPTRVDVTLRRAACPPVFVESFQIDVRDAFGRPLCDASVVARDGRSEQTLRASKGPDGACFWSGSDGRPGTYQVTVSMPGFETVVVPEVVVELAENQCTVRPAEIDVRLEPATVACTEEIVETLAVDIRDERGAEVCDARVVASSGGLDIELVPSPVGGGDCYWSGLPERPGLYTVTVSKPGYLTRKVGPFEASLDALGCHVVPVPVNVTIQPDIVVPPLEP